MEPFWMKANPDVQLYHGTSSKYLDSIAKNGLRVTRRETRIRSSRRGGGEYFPMATAVTDDLELARYYAVMQALPHAGDDDYSIYDGIILLVDVDTEDLEPDLAPYVIPHEVGRLRYEKEGQYADKRKRPKGVPVSSWLQSMTEVHAAILRRDIPPDKIAVLETIPSKVVERTELEWLIRDKESKLAAGGYDDPKAAKTMIRKLKARVAGMY